MKKSKGMQLGAMLAAMMLLLVVFASMPASAYSAPGYRWSGTSAYYGWDWWGSIPSDWKNPIRNAAGAWNTAGSVFRLNEDYWTGNIYKASLGTSGPLARTQGQLNGNTITSIQTTFNSDKTWSTTGESGKNDVQNTATHEFGHWLVLGDLYGSGDTEITMYYTANLGETKKRTLEQDDKNGIIYIYG